MADGYRKIHHLLGRADAHICACGRPAFEWAYQHTGETLYSPEGAAYSEDPDDYEAMCRSCHKTLDYRLTPERLEGSRTSFRRRAEQNPEASAEAIARANSAVQKRWAEDPEFAAERTAAQLTALRKQRKCLGCGMQSTTYGITSHQRGSGHTGYEDVSNDQKAGSS